VRRDRSQAGVIWCMSRGGVELFHCIESSVWPQSFREAGGEDFTADVVIIVRIARSAAPFWAEECRKVVVVDVP
jgi:hypothetical protein